METMNGTRTMPIETEFSRAFVALEQAKHAKQHALLRHEQAKKRFEAAKLALLVAEGN